MRWCSGWSHSSEHTWPLEVCDLTSGEFCIHPSSQLIISTLMQSHTHTGCARANNQQSLSANHTRLNKADRHTCCLPSLKSRAETIKWSRTEPHVHASTEHPVTVLSPKNLSLHSLTQSGPESDYLDKWKKKQKNGSTLISHICAPSHKAGLLKLAA